jgi:hypothetical protein
MNNIRPLMDVLGADVGAAVPLVAVEVIEEVLPPIRVGDGTTLPVRVRVAVCSGRFVAAGEGLAGARVGVTPLVAVGGGRVGATVNVGEGASVGKSKTEVGVIVAITICVGSLGGGKGFNE